ncbi:uncharacterized protein [Macrobrachium rosenbergii]|uniref:uncharacterized protein n=1 Tax=Macrobrachium rosenbergii TaxID=79674 RepID=UPI0034D57682
MAIGRAAEQLNERLGTREGEKDIYKISNLRKEQRQDLGKLGVIKDRDGNILFRDEDIKKRRREYRGEEMDAGFIKEEEMPRDWEESLMSTERILDERLREILKIGKQQCGFIRGRGMVDAIFIVRQLQKKRLEGNQELYCAFIGMEKAYDRIPRDVMFCV